MENHMPNSMTDTKKNDGGITPGMYKCLPTALPSMPKANAPHDRFWGEPKVHHILLEKRISTRNVLMCQQRQSSGPETRRFNTHDMNHVAEMFQRPEPRKMEAK